MTDASINELYKAIGTLTAEVAGLRRDIQDAEATARQSDNRAIAHRAAVHRRVDDLGGEIGELKTDMAGVKRDVTDTKAVTDEVIRWKLMGLGALGVTGLAAGAISSLLTYFWSDLVRLVRGV